MYNVATAIPLSERMPRSSGPWRGVHRALADPLRIRLFELLWLQASSAKELADIVGLPPDRLYYHLRHLEGAGLIEVSGYRQIGGGKVERVYQRVEVEPPSEESDPETVSTFLGSLLDATKADIRAAFLAKEEGRQREVHLQSSGLCLTAKGISELRAAVENIIARYGPDGDDAGDCTWVRSVFVLVDLEDRS
jgi:DNA-binding transcriptional ArsR family regulator